jgi:alpha-glucoside transport system substrate-binding protein
MMMSFILFLLIEIGATIGAAIAMGRAKMGWWKALLPLPIGAALSYGLGMMIVSSGGTTSNLTCAGFLVDVGILAALIVMSRQAREALKMQQLMEKTSQEALPPLFFPTHREPTESKQAKCDICDAAIREPNGYQLTTTQVVCSPRFWYDHYQRHREEFVAMGISSYDVLQESPAGKTLIERVVGDATPWLVCEQCIYHFDVDREQARSYVRQWWKDQTFVPPGSGPTLLSEVRMVESPAELPALKVKEVSEPEKPAPVPSVSESKIEDKASQQTTEALPCGMGKIARPLALPVINPTPSAEVGMGTEAVAPLFREPAETLAPASEETLQQRPARLSKSYGTPQEVRLSQGIPRWPVAVALLNLNGLGLGYLYCHQWRRWLVHFLLTTGLLVVAFMANSARAPLVWIIAFGLWLLWMGIDGWRQARRLAQAGVTEAIGRPWLPVALAILLIGLAIGSFGFYTVSGQQELRAGMAAYGLADCRTALPYFNHVTTWYRLTLDPNLIAAEAKNTECNLLVEAENSRHQYKHEEAVTAYETYIGTYPNAAPALPAKTAVAETYVEWATYLRADHNYSLALEKYGIILEKYADTPPGQQVGSLIPEAYYEWGQYLVSQNRYQTALETFEQVQNSTHEPDMLAKAKQGHQNALLALGRDMGEDGQTLIKETWYQVKDGASATSPAIGIIDNEPGRFWYEGNQLTLSDQLRAVKPGHFRYAVYLDESEKEVQRCSYTSRYTVIGTVIRRQRIWTVLVRDTLTGQVVDRKTFEGPSPASCPFMENFGSSSIKSILGWTPAPEDVQNWLARIFTNPPMPQEKPLEVDSLPAGASVRVMTTFSGGDEEALFNQVNKRFTELTGVKVVHEGIRDLEEAISTRVAAGGPPDVALLPLPGQLQRFAGQGVLVPLWPKIIEQVQHNYAPVWLALGAYNGTPYGVFYRVNTRGLVWYPKKAFEAAGYKEPTTWAEMIALSDQIVADGGTPWCIGMESGAATGWVGTDWLEDIMLRTAGPEVYDQWVNHEIPFNDPRVKEAAEYMRQIWFNPDYVLGGTASILTQSFAEGSSLMFENPPQCYMFRQGSFVIGFWPENIRANLDEEVGVFAFPQINQEWAAPAVVAGDQIVMFNDRPEVRAYMEYLTTSESVEPWARAGRAVFPHQDQDLSWYQTDMEREMASLIRNAQVIRFDASDSMPAEVGASSFWKGMADWVSGVNLDTVLAEIDASWPSE